MSLISIAHAQNHGAEGTDAYDFPVKPGTEAWKALETHAEMLEISRIPEAALQGMSTEGLVETVLSHPLYGDMLAYNSLQQGFNAVVSGFNGLPELLNRQDAGTELLARYRAMNPAAIEESWTLEQQGKYDMSFTYIEMLLAQDAILDSLTETQRRDLLAEALAKSQSKQQYAKIYGQFGQERTALLIGRALQQTNADAFNQKVMENAVLKDFLDDGTFASVEVLNEIFSQAQQFLFGKVSAYSGDNTIQDCPGTVYTPNGSPVSVLVRTYELTSAQINEMNNWVETHYPNATRETNASRKYNCHSYAWHSTSTSNNKRMNSPGDDTCWEAFTYLLSLHFLRATLLRAEQLNCNTRHLKS